MTTGITRIGRALAVSGLCFALLAGCTQEQKDFWDTDKADHIDPVSKLTREDYKDKLMPNTRKTLAIQESAKGEPPIPEMSDILIAPRPPQIGENKRVSISVTEDVPLKDVLIELSRLADIDLELDSDISGGIIFRAKDKPFNEVIERIASMAGLTYSIDKGTLRVAVDKPIVESYPVDFLNVTRSSDSSVSINTNVLSASGGTSGGGGSDSFNTGSNASITAVSESDLWEKLEEGVESILQASAAPLASANPGLGAAPGLAPAAMPVATQAAAGTANAAAVPANATPIGATGEFFYVINRQAGILTVSATEAAHVKIAKYIKTLRASASAQVLIEAKIVEVTLNDEYRSGIDWSTLSFGENFNLDVNYGNVFEPGNFVAMTIGEGAGLGLDALVQLTETFGTSRTLSSPRLNAINNQQAVLTFAENRVFFEINVERERDINTINNNELLTIDSEVKTVPIGIIVTLQPSINVDTNEVTLNIRPTLSRITGTVSDPAVAYLATLGDGINISNEIPVVEVRELDSILKVQSGQVMVIGGLMEEKSTNIDSGVPFVSRIPWVGNAFKSVTKDSEVVEMVIFIKATVIDSPATATVGKQDREMYRTFTNDPRPLTF